MIHYRTVTGHAVTAEATLLVIANSIIVWTSISGKTLINIHAITDTVLLIAIEAFTLVRTDGVGALLKGWTENSAV